MHENKLVDVFSSLFLIVSSIVLFASTFTFRQLTVTQFGSGFLPQVVAIGLFGFSVILFVNAFTNWKKEKNLREENSNSKKTTKEKNDYTLVFISLGLMVVYLILISFLGFLLATAGYLFIQMYLIAPAEKRSLLKFAVVSVLISGFVYWIFRNVFYLMLPAGILG